MEMQLLIQDVFRKVILTLLYLNLRQKFIYMCIIKDIIV